MDWGLDMSLPEVQSVAAAWGVGPNVTVSDGPYGRGLFAARDIARGENIISVPLTACLLAEREEALYAPGASWEELTQGRVQGYERLQGFYEQYPLPWVRRHLVGVNGLLLHALSCYCRCLNVHSTSCCHCAGYVLFNLSCYTLTDNINYISVI